MAKLKITKEQYQRLFESTAVAGGINRVNKSFAGAVNNSKVKNLSEEPFNIKSPVSGIPNSSMKSKKEVQINEDASNGIYQAIHDFIENIWAKNPTKDISPAFEQMKLSWEDVVNYLIAAGIVVNIGEGEYKIKNYFNTKFSKKPEELISQKLQDIDKLAKMLEQDPKAPWASKEEKTPSVKTDVEENGGSPYPANTETDPNAPWNYQEPKLDRSNAPKVFTPVVLGLELAILKGPNGLYVFNLDDVSRKDLPNAEYDLSAEDIADYINDNIKIIKQGEGVEGFNADLPLVKIDDALKNEILGLYSNDKKIVQALQQVQEMTSAAGGSSGAFTGPLNASPIKKGLALGELSEVDGEVEKTLDEVTTTVPNNATSSSTGAYVQPQIWAKDKKNWAASKKTQYPKGEMVDFDPCTKLNNNKKATNGGCSQGAKDGVVKTHRTKQSVISKTVYETIAKRTGRSIEDIKKLIETKVNNGKPLS